MEISLRDLKANLSAVVHRVAAGETAIVTSHRKPVARLVPPAPSGDSVADRLLAAGITSTRPLDGGLTRRAPNPLPGSSASVAQAVVEDRD